MSVCLYVSVGQISAPVTSRTEYLRTSWSPFRVRYCQQATCSDLHDSCKAVLVKPGQPDTGGRFSLFCLRSCVALMTFPETTDFCLNSTVRRNSLATLTLSIFWHCEAESINRNYRINILKPLYGSTHVLSVWNFQ